MFCLYKKDYEVVELIKQGYEEAIEVQRKKYIHLLTECLQCIKDLDSENNYAGKFAKKIIDTDKDLQDNINPLLDSISAMMESFKADIGRK